MSLSRKYGRTYHYSFSPGTSSDDRMNHNYWEDMKAIPTVIHTEKLDGENNCLSRFGVFARSHTAPTISPWTKSIRERWELIKNDLGDIEIFGENLYAIHSIEYRKLESHFYVFAVRSDDIWLSWEEVRYYAALFDFPTVPVLKTISTIEKSSFQEELIALASQNSRFDSYDVKTERPCTCEGVVTRNEAAFHVDDFAHHVFKYVRSGHVKTDEHWTRNWRRAKLIWEFPTKLN